MQQQQTYELVTLDAGVWAIEMKMVRAFLVAGETSALLIDTGAGGVNLTAAIRACTALPVRVVNTHAHYDHISGNGAFDMQFAHPLEIGSLSKAGFNPRPIGDGSGFDLGGRILQIVTLPGHSPGSIGVWDADAGLLFAGDTVAKGRPVILSLDGASLEAFVRTMERILGMERDEHGRVVRKIYCAHGDLEATMETVEQLKDCAQRVIAGEVSKSPLPEPFRSHFPDNIGTYQWQQVSIIAP